MDKNQKIQQANAMNKEDEILPDDIAGDEETIENKLGDDEGTKEKTVEGKKDYGEKGTTKEKDESNKQTRRSERIKKQRVEIHPDDTGEDDNVNDKDYK